MRSTVTGSGDMGTNLFDWPSLTNVLVLRLLTGGSVDLKYWYSEKMWSSGSCCVLPCSSSSLSSNSCECGCEREWYKRQPWGR